MEMDKRHPFAEIDEEHVAPNMPAQRGEKKASRYRYYAILVAPFWFLFLIMLFVLGFTVRHEYLHMKMQFEHKFESLDAEMRNLRYQADNNENLISWLVSNISAKNFIPNITTERIGSAYINFNFRLDSLNSSINALIEDTKQATSKKFESLDAEMKNMRYQANNNENLISLLATYISATNVNLTITIERIDRAFNNFDFRLNSLNASINALIQDTNQATSKKIEWQDAGVNNLHDRMNRMEVTSSLLSGNLSVTNDNVKRLDNQLREMSEISTKRRPGIIINNG